jgi:2-polyprenyl-3-methyl-5-hydroxy-6-metoxy-1,4-benzoquinol methylase
MMAPFADLTEIVRTGTTTKAEEGGIVSEENAVWVEFARAMAPMMFPPAMDIAGLVAGDREIKVLDVAAGHGIFGIMIAKQNPKAQITALDWSNVLAVAKENAERFGVAAQHSLLPGDAFKTDFGGPYDVVLATNFFHHFDKTTCVELMEKFHAALVPGGTCVTLEFVPNEDRVSPPIPARFAMMMLGTTPAGNAYTFGEYEEMFGSAGFASSEMHPLMKSPETVILSRR